MVAYVLNWTHRYVENDVVVTDNKLMGVYTSEEKANQAIEEYKKNPTYEPYCDDKIEEWGQFEVESSTVDTLYDEEGLP